jgi:TonB family protein
MKPLTLLQFIFAIGTFSAYSQESALVPDSAAQIASITTHQALQGDTTRPPADFLAVDTEPVVISKKEPVYPEPAIRAGIEGKVWVKIWVDRAGLPHDVVLIKSDQEIFNVPALDAARQFRFTPATMDGKPVDVWVSVPFKFKLAEKREGIKTITDTAWGKVPAVIMKFVRVVLEGGSPDPDVVNAFVPSGAQSIANGSLKPLVLALKDQREGKHSLEEPGRKMAFLNEGMADDGRSGYLVVRTDKTGKKPHFHTIVIREDVGLIWKIVQWHSSK